MFSTCFPVVNQAVLQLNQDRYQEEVSGITTDTYWNHNTAYHRWILKHAKGRNRALDVGCGDGLLVQKLSRICNHVVGIDPHGPCIKAAKRRFAGSENVSLIEMAFETYTGPPNAFDLIIFVASLHHMDQARAMEKAKNLLAPGGLLLIVGCVYPQGLADWCMEILRVTPAKIGSYMHGEKSGGNIGAPVATPTLPLKKIRDICRHHFPGATIRLGLYYRYLLQWSKPII